MIVKRLLKCSYQESNELLDILDYTCIKEIDDQIKIQTKEIDSMLNVLKGQLKQAFVVDTNYNFKEDKIIVNLTKKETKFFNIDFDLKTYLKDNIEVYISKKNLNIKLEYLSENSFLIKLIV